MLFTRTSDLFVEKYYYQENCYRNMSIGVAEFTSWRDYDHQVDIQMLTCKFPNTTQIKNFEIFWKLKLFSRLNPSQQESKSTSKKCKSKYSHENNIRRLQEYLQSRFSRENQLQAYEAPDLLISHLGIYDQIQSNT